jgi:hypothetical protein
LYGVDDTAESVPVMVLEGFAALLLASPPEQFVDYAKGVLLNGLPASLRPQVQSARTINRPVTRWGEQPMRGVLKAMGVSVADAAGLMSRVRGREPLTVKVSTMNAVLFGRQLPTPEFLSRARYVLQKQPGELFTAAALEAFGVKHGASPAGPAQRPRPKTLGLVKGGPADLSSQEGFAPSVPSSPSPAPARVPDFEPPFSILSPEEIAELAGAAAAGPDLEDDAPIDPLSLGLSEEELDVVYGEVASEGFPLVDPPWELSADPSVLPTSEVPTPPQ